MAAWLESERLRAREAVFAVFKVSLKVKYGGAIYAICGWIGRNRSLLSHLIFILFKV